MSACGLAGSHSRYETGQNPGGEALTERMIGLTGLAPGARVLDIGCGRGDAVVHLRNTLGLDALGADRARDHFSAGRPLVQAVAGQLPFASNSLDAVLAECSLSVMGEREPVLAECARVLKADGWLLISDLYPRRSTAMDAIRRLNHPCLAGMIIREELRNQLGALGFTIHSWEDHSYLLARFLSRFLMESDDESLFWGRGAAGGEEERCINDTLRQAHPGYFLLVARKKGVNGNGV